MTPLVATWAIGFLVNMGLMMAVNLSSPDPDDHWPPSAVLLAAAWPLLLLIYLVTQLVEALTGE